MVTRRPKEQSFLDFDGSVDDIPELCRHSFCNEQGMEVEEEQHIFKQLRGCCCGHGCSHGGLDFESVELADVVPKVRL
jgi:hypothetical protein